MAGLATSTSSQRSVYNFDLYTTHFFGIGSMAKRKATRPWNKGREVGQRAPLSIAEVARIKKSLTRRGASGLSDLALFSTAIDTMIRAQVLLGLTVKDVRKRNRVMRDTLELTTLRYEQRISCVLSKSTMNVLEKWINQSAKKANDYLFTGRLGGGLTPMSPRQFSRLVKTWTQGIGLDESAYGIASLRRTRAVHLLNKTGNLEAVRVLLGLADVATTARYLGEPY